jgi:hypothetical protein
MVDCRSADEGECVPEEAKRRATIAHLVAILLNLAGLVIEIAIRYVTVIVACIQPSQVQKSRLERSMVLSLANGGLEVVSPAGLDLEERPIVFNRNFDASSHYQGAEDAQHRTKKMKKQTQKIL